MNDIECELCGHIITKEYAYTVNGHNFCGQCTRLINDYQVLVGNAPPTGPRLMNMKLSDIEGYIKACKDGLGLWKERYEHWLKNRDADTEWNQMQMLDEMAGYRARLYNIERILETVRNTIY